MAEPAADSPPPTLVDRLARRVGELVSYLFFACMVIIAYEVVARYGFNAPTVWAHDLTTALCAVGFVISGAYTLQRRQHIRISIIYESMPAAVRQVLDVINAMIVIVFLALLGYQAAIGAQKSIAIMETAGTASRLPLPVIIKSALFIAVALMLLVAIGQWLRAVRRR